MDANKISQLLESVCHGDEDAFHTFLEIGREFIPSLIDKYAATAEGEQRARIVEAIWQHRSSSTIPFLATALLDPHSEVWKQALDGLVTIGGPMAYSALKETLTTFPRDDIRFEWIEEAMSQLVPRSDGYDP